LRADIWQTGNFFVYGGLAFAVLCLGLLIRHDWLRLTRPSRRVLAEVIGHHSRFQGGAMAFSAIYGFYDEAGAHEVTDAVTHAEPEPEEGETIELVYPAGRPDLARPPRLLTWLGVYATFVFILGMTTAKLLGWLD
jgi:hypothetical protein